jgi:uncharacterized membrane protein YesL
MIRALRLLRSSLSAWYYDLFVLIGVNVVWLILSLLIIPLGPATAGLFYVCNELAKGEPISFGLFWVGMKRYMGLSVKLAAALIIITVLLGFNISFYLNMQSSIGQIIGIVWIYAVIFWGIVLNYPFALLVQMDKPSLRKILRNSALLVLDNVVFTVSMSILTLLVIGLSIFPLGLLPFPFGFFALLAIFQCKCLITLMEKYEQKHPEAPASG